MKCVKLLFDLPVLKRVLTVSILFLFFQEFWSDRQGRRRPGRRGINLNEEQMVRMTCVLKEVQAQAERIAFIQNAQRNQPPALHRVDTIHLPDTATTAPLAAATVPAVTPTLAHEGPAPTLMHEGLRSESAGEVLMSAAMSQIQNHWNESPSGASFDGALSNYSPAHETEV